MRLRQAHLLFGGRGTDVDRLVLMLLKLLEIQWAIIQCTGQAKSVFHQNSLTRAIPCVHAADLRKRSVAFVDHEQKIFREEIHQSVGLRACWPSA